MGYVLSRDPGQKPGYALFTWESALLRVSHKEEAWALEDIDLLITEGQWWRPNPQKKVDPNRLFTLAFEAGWGARGIPAKRHMVFLPQEWRGRTTLDKGQVQRRILRSLSDAERKLFKGVPAMRHGDCLDAIGMGRHGIEVALRYPDGCKNDWPHHKRPSTRRTK